jgi:hypothetical protein
MNTFILKDTYKPKEGWMVSSLDNYYVWDGANSGTAPQIGYSSQSAIKIIERLPVYIWNIETETKKYYAPKPIKINIYFDGDFCFSENEDLAIYGSGDNLISALEDFRLHITHFFEYYKEMDESNLMGEALRMKIIYKDLLIEEGT